MKFVKVEIAILVAESLQAIITPGWVASQLQELLNAAGVVGRVGAKLILDEDTQDKIPAEPKVKEEDKEKYEKDFVALTKKPKKDLTDEGYTLGG